MSYIIRLTQEFYQQRREMTDAKNLQEIIEANHVGWNSVANQLKTFEIATDLYWINWQAIESVLDVGCGYGKLLEFLISERFYTGKYLEIDIVPEFVKKAIKIYDNKPENKFLVGDFLKQDLNQKFDVVISLGGLSVNHDYPDECGQKSVEYAQRLISKCVHLSNYAVSLYYPNADHIIYYSAKSPRMAFYKSSEIEAMLLEACGERYRSMRFISYPDKKNAKTIVTVKLSS